jgi:hypothetical protein
MNRRKFMLLLVCAATPSVGAQGQQGIQRKRIGFLWESPTTFPDALAAFRQGLRPLGYVEGEDLVIEFRWAEGKPERMRGTRQGAGSAAGGRFGCAELRLHRRRQGSHLHDTDHYNEPCRSTADWARSQPLAAM